MEVRFFHDPDTGLPHIYQHDVSEPEVLDVLRRPAFGGHGRNDSLVAEGQTRDGRHLPVIYKRDEDGSVFVITAYDLQGKALKAHKRRRRRRPQ